MPASPRDFALWSSMTGNPMPQSDYERAALAPHVYQYVNSIGRKGGARGLLDVAGKTALAAGAIAGAVALSRTPAGQQVIEEVSKSVGPHVQGIQRGVSNIAGQLLPESEGGAGEYAADLGRKIGGGAQSFLGGFKEGVRARVSPGASQVETPVEQAVGVSRPVTYGRGSRPVNTGRVTWGRGEEGIPGTVRGISDPWQERPSGVVVIDLSKVQEQGVAGTPYEIQEDLQPGPGLVEQQLDNEYASINNDYANKAAAYRKSKQYADMAALHPGLQNIGPNEELVGGASGAARALPTQDPVKTTDLYGQRNIPEPIRTGQAVSGANPESPLKDLLGTGGSTQPSELVTEQPMRPSVPAAVGPSPQEISELDAAFAKALGHLAPEQRAALRDAELDKKYGGQSGVRQLTAEAGPSPQIADAGAMVNTPVAVVAANPVAKANQWRQARVRAERGENARVGRLGSYGYDPYEPVEETSVMQEVPGSRQALLAEQLQRNAMLQAEIPGHYAYAAQKRQAVPNTPYNPQEFRSFMKPASAWLGG